jgi:hypothetical protein
MTDSSNMRSLTPTKLAAALAASKVPSDKSVAETPTAFDATKSYSIPLVCARSGLTVGSLAVITVAGHMPVVGQWRDSMVLHPLFSLSPVALLHFGRNTWFRFCNFSVEEGADDTLTAKQEQTLRVTALAMLHNLTEIRQDIPWMPSWTEVVAQWSSLMALSYWKNYLDSQRFKFPSIHISRLESEFSLKDYLQVCWNVKKGYETTVNEKIEAEKLKAADAAMIALRDEIAGARPTSVRQLWRWFVANMPKRYKKDLETWMAEIFFAKGEEIRQFTPKDIDMLEEIFLCECPTGSSISHAFSEVLASKRKYLQQHFEAFEIIIPAEILAAKESGAIAPEQPKLEDYPTRAQWFIANARWKLAYTDMSKRIDASLAKQSQLTVKPSHKPTLVIREDDPVDEDDGGDDIVTDAFLATREDDDVSGEIEE